MHIVLKYTTNMQPKKKESDRSPIFSWVWQPTYYILSHGRQANLYHSLGLCGRGTSTLQYAITYSKSQVYI